MRSHTARLYVAAATLLVFFVLWATIAARPWAAPTAAPTDPRVLALTTRERALRREAAQVEQLVARRWRVYKRRLRARERAIALARRRHQEQLTAAARAAARIAARPTAYAPPSSPASTPVTPTVRTVTLPPQVHVVTLPPVTATSSSHP